MHHRMYNAALIEMQQNTQQIKGTFHYDLTHPLPHSTILTLKLTLHPMDKSLFKADLHIACRAHAVPLPCRAAKSVSLPFDSHSAAVSDSHFPCHAHAMLRPCRSSQCHNTARPSLDGTWTGVPSHPWHQQYRWKISEPVNTVKCSRWWAKTSPETCRAD